MQKEKKSTIIFDLQTGTLKIATRIIYGSQATEDKKKGGGGGGGREKHMNFS